MATVLTATGTSPELAAQSVQHILSGAELCTIATRNQDGTPYANTCFYAFDHDFKLFVLTPPSTQHSRNIEACPPVAVTIFDSHQKSGSELRGLQIIGECYRIKDGPELSAAFDVYMGRFPSIKSIADTVDEMLKVFESRLYEIQPKTIKILDEPTFGKEVWVTAVVH